MILGSETILLVEDDANDKVLLQKTFDEFNLAKQVQAVPTGEDAIAFFEGKHPYPRGLHPLPTVVFLDLKLPGISGFEVLTWLRQQQHLNDIRVVVLTGSKKSLDVYRAYELGANSYLVKPVHAEDIARLAESLKLPWLALAEQGGSQHRLASRTADWNPAL
ncbi:MAG: response regulator [Verrucomicrobiia bacterium]